MGQWDVLENDASILDDEWLYRGILEEWLVQDRTRPSSLAFVINRSDPHISVDRGTLTTPDKTKARLSRNVAVAQLQAKSARDVTIGVASKPKPDNPAHALIIRDLSLAKPEWKRRARKLARSCSWAIGPS